MSRFEVPEIGTQLQGKVVVLTGMFWYYHFLYILSFDTKTHFSSPLSISPLTQAKSTGGALGIGSELVRLLHSHGSHIFFGDVLIPQGEALAAELSASSQPNQQIKFLYTNVQDHLANLGLFDLALNTCGKVDHAVSVAGINREENIVDKALTLESVREVCCALAFGTGDGRVTLTVY
jgi:hypothetical protein